MVWTVELGKARSSLRLPRFATPMPSGESRGFQSQFEPYRIHFPRQ